jgi:serine/threonine protein kinase/protein involved in polysaccharide export with SLBB domain
MMTETCPNCGEELTIDNAAGGLCGHCLLERGIALASTACLADASTPGTPPFAAPDPIEVEADLLSFDVLELVGQGGMGAVYKARQRNLDRTVAIKILPRQSGGHEFADRFQREARALARLRHDNIVMAYDFGLTDRYSYCVMEYVGGPNLRQYLRSSGESASKLLSPQGRGRERGESEIAQPASQPSPYPLPTKERDTPRLDPRHALEIARDVCTALQYAHENGVVHRDIKPENVLLDETGRVKIADFGLAKLLATDPRELALTQTRHFMGTVHYMAPEQCERPQATDHRADIYSLGVMLYELLTGELPLGRFELPSSKADVDPRVDNVVLRALEKDPAKRYATAAEFGEAIDDLLVTPDLVPDRSVAPDLAPAVDATPVERLMAAPSGGRNRRATLIAVGLLGFFALAFLGWSIFIRYQHDKDGQTTFTFEAAGGDTNQTQAQRLSQKDFHDSDVDPLKYRYYYGEKRTNAKSDPASKSNKPRVVKRIPLTNVKASKIAEIVQGQFTRSGIEIVTDERTNAILAHGDADKIAELEGLVQRLDKWAAEGKTADAQKNSPAEEMHVFALKDLLASDAQGILQQNLPNFTGRIAVDDRTNSVIVGADRETMNKVASIIKRIDQLPASADKQWPANNPGRLDPGEEIRLSAFGTLPDAPIRGMYPIDPDGYVNLGAEYGKVKVAGLTVHEAVDAILAELKKTLDGSKLAVQIEGVFRGDTTRDRRRGSSRTGSHATPEDLKRQREQVEAEIATARARKHDLQVQRGAPNAQTKLLDDDIFYMDRRIRMLENSLRESELLSGPRATIINPGYKLRISVAGTLPDASIKGVYTVDPDGYVNLGAEYGKVRVSGMSSDEAQAAILTELKKTLKDPKIVITIDSVDGRNTPDDRRSSSDALPPELQKLTAEDRKLLAEKPAASDGHALEHDAGHAADVVRDDEVSFLRRVDPPVREANKTAKRTEELQLQIAHVEAMQKDSGRLAVAYEMYGHVPRTIFGLRGNAEAEFVVPYLLVVKGPHLGRKEFVLPSWPPAVIQAEDYAGTFVAPRKLRINNGEPLEIHIEQGSIPGKAPVRVSNVIKLTWRIPGAPTEDIRYPKDLMRLFSAIHWEKDKPQLQMGDTWYDLLAVNDLTIDTILDDIKKKHPREFQRTFEDKLPDILKELGVSLEEGYSLTLRGLADGRREIFDIKMDDQRRPFVSPRRVEDAGKAEEKPAADKESEDPAKK